MMFSVVRRTLNQGQTVKCRYSGLIPPYSAHRGHISRANNAKNQISATSSRNVGAFAVAPTHPSYEKVFVLGGGPAGLAAATMMAKKGYMVSSPLYSQNMNARTCLVGEENLLRAPSLSPAPRGGACRSPVANRPTFDPFYRLHYLALQNVTVVETRPSADHYEPNLSFSYNIDPRGQGVLTQLDCFEDVVRSSVCSTDLVPRYFNPDGTLSKAGVTVRSPDNKIATSLSLQSCYGADLALWSSCFRQPSSLDCRHFLSSLRRL